MTFNSFLQRIQNRIKGLCESIYTKPYLSYSQCGEDMIARYYLPKTNGFYVDIGAYHPQKISNTNHFFKKGWRGINIDGSKSTIVLYNKYRPNDININCCIGDTNSDVLIDFYKFQSAELNTFKKESLPDILQYHKQSPIEIEKILLCSLRSIFEKHLTNKIEIDLLTIDAEGADEEILKSNDWEKYRPKIVIIEKHCNLYDFTSTTMHNFLLAKGYTLAGYSRFSYVFNDVNYII